MFKIGKTDFRNTNQFHMHKVYEIITYTEGSGTFCTNLGDYFFVPGSIIIIPPGVKHCTKSKSGYKNIYINGDLEQFFHFEEPIILMDNEQNEGKQLANMIYNHRLENGEFLSSLCSSYLHFVLKNLKVEDGISTAVNKIIYQITDNFHDHNLNLKELLYESGYAEDYIRAHFKKITGKTPNEFLTDTRIKHACLLIEIYDKSLSLTDISEQCGYIDYVYFSKKFKSVTGICPQKYKKEIN